MSDRSAFERQVRAVLQAAAGPSRPVDASSVVDRLTSRATIGRLSPTTRRFRVEPRSFRPERGFTMYSAFKLVAAAAVLLLFGSLLLLGGAHGPGDDAMVPAADPSSELAPVTSIDSEAVPVSTEVLFELAVPSEAFPEAFYGLAIEDLTLAAGTDVTGDRYSSQANESMRNRAFVITSGVFVIEPTTDALVWRALDSPPDVTPAGGAVTLGPGEAIYLPAVPAGEVDRNTYLRIANPGSEDATAWSFHAHQAGAPFGGFPPGLTAGSWHLTSPVAVRDAADWLAGGDVHFQLNRHVGGPGAALTMPAAPAASIYLVESGLVQHAVSGADGQPVPDQLLRARGELAIPAFEGVEQTLTVVGDEDASILELVATPPSTAGGQ